MFDVDGILENEVLIDDEATNPLPLFDIVELTQSPAIVTRNGRWTQRAEPPEVTGDGLV